MVTDGIINCTLFNAHSLMNKLSELHQLLDSNRYDCVLVTESWLNPDIPNGLLDPEHRYTVFRSDRTARRGGGVCIFVASKLRCHEIMLADTEKFDDAAAVDLMMLDIVAKQNKYRFMLIYRTRPARDVDNGCAAAEIAAATRLCDTLGRHQNRCGPTIILGDINCPGIDWSYGCQPSTIVERSLYNFCQSNGFTQCVPESTRGPNLLDVVCLNEPMLLSAITVQPPFSKSDHDSVDFTLVFKNDTTEDDVINAKRYLWTQGNYEAMAEYLNEVNWAEMFTVNFIPDDIWNAFCVQLDAAIDLFIPASEVQSRSRVNARQYPRHIRRLMARKLTVWRAYKMNRSNERLKERYQQITADCRNAVRRHDIYIENKVVSTGNIGVFYKHVNKRLSSRSSIATLVTPCGQMAHTDADKAEILNDYFSSVCSDDDGNHPAFAPVAAADDDINTVHFDAARILSAARRIKTKSATSSGPDGYPVMLVRNTIGVLAQPLAQMYNSFMSVGKMPTSWKSANVTPIFKKGPSSDPGNYRPISQTSVFGKLMERVIVADIIDYMFSKGFITKQQHGFLCHKSTSTNLLETMSDWTIAVENKQTQTVIYVDFSKAFDTVCHAKLITKLKGYGISGDLLNVITDFLTDRQQRTRVGQKLSSSKFLRSSIVQGSCLGPALFLIFINDLAKIFDAIVTPKLYADDIKIYSTIESDVDNNRLQLNIDRLAQWAKTWQLKISIKKCQSMHVSRNRFARAALNATFHIDADQLPSVELVRDLGVEFDSDLKFSTHINHIVRKASTRCYLLRRCFTSRDTATLVRAFKVYVLPIVEYCSVVWSPHLVRDIELMESVQRRFTKRLPGLWNVQYSQRLRKVGLERLDVRRVRLDLIMTYKILFGLVRVDSIQFFTPSHNTITRGHKYKLYAPAVTTDLRKYFFSNRVVHIWNDLPIDTDFGSLKRFNYSIASLDLTKYCIDLR